MITKKNQMLNLKRFGKELFTMACLKAEVLLLRADVKELSEEIRHNKKILV